MANRRTITNAMRAKPDFDEQSGSAFVLQKNPNDKAQADRLADVPVVEKDNETARRSYISPVGLVPVTVRLRPQIAGALKRASLERELNGEELHTQQDIVSGALEPWLKQQGFLC